MDVGSCMLQTKLIVIIVVEIYEWCALRVKGNDSMRWKNLQRSMGKLAKCKSVKKSVLQPKTSAWNIYMLWL